MFECTVCSKGFTSSDMTKRCKIHSREKPCNWTKALLTPAAVHTLCILLQTILLVHGQVTIIFVVSVCLSACLCRVFLSRLRSDLDQTRTHVTCPGLVVSRKI